MNQKCPGACFLSPGGCCDGPSLGWDVQLPLPSHQGLTGRGRQGRVVCCSVISTPPVGVWIGYSAAALSGSKREYHDLLLVEEKGIEIFLVFIRSLVWCFLGIFFLCFLGHSLLCIFGLIFSPTGRLEEYLNCMDKIQKAVEYFQDNNPDSPELNRVVGCGSRIWHG